MEIYLSAFGNVKGKAEINGQVFTLSGSQETIAVGDISSFENLSIIPEGGKFGDSEDNFLFIYTPINPAEENFELSGEFSVQTKDGLRPGRQAGCGIFAADTDASGQIIRRHRNLISIGRYRMTSPFESGCGMRVVSGYSSPDAAEFGSVRKIDTTRTSRTVGHLPQISEGESFFFLLRKTDEGFSAEISSGGKSESFSFPGCSILMKQDPEKIFAGFAAAGELRIRVRNIHFHKSPGIVSETPDSAVVSAIPDYPFSRFDISEDPSCGTSSLGTLYVSPEGDPTSPGTDDSPTDLRTALAQCRPGSRIVLRDGIYAPDRPYIAGSSGNRKISAEHPGKAVLDGSSLTNTVPLMILSGSEWHLEGLDFKNSPSSGLFICGSRNLVEHCRAYENQDTGILLCAFPGSSQKEWPSFNEVRYCESFDNCDSERDNADGFGAKLSVGEGNRFYGCNAHHNIDDGFDLYTKSIVGPISPVTIENCAAWENGHLSHEKENRNTSRGVGFKFGGENQAVEHILRNCSAYRNDAAGFASNSNPASRLIGLTSRQNGICPREYDYRLTTARTDMEPAWQIPDPVPADHVYIHAGGKKAAVGTISESDPILTEPAEENLSEKDSARIMFLVPRLSGGGAEKMITSLASYMAETHPVVLVTTIRENDQQPPYPISDKVRCINLYKYAEEKAEQPDSETVSSESFSSDAAASFRKVCGIIREKLSGQLKPIRKHVEYFRDNRNTLSQIETLKELKRKYRIDCAVSFLNSANYLNVRSNIGEKTIISIRSYLEGPYSPAETRTEEGIRKIEISCRLANTIVPVSKEIGLELSSRWGAESSRITPIHNFTDVPQIRALCRETAKDQAITEILDRAEFVFCTVGRLTEKKGQWHLIRAFRKVVSRHPGAVLVILGHEGKGTENTAPLLNRVILENGLEKNVFLLGFHLNPFKYSQKADAFVLTSFNEGFPNAVTEAMALGIPVISTDCRSGPREILAPGTDCRVKTAEVEYAEFGILVPECSGNKNLCAEPLEDSEEKLASTMLELVEDRALCVRYMLKSMERAAQFRKEDIIFQWKSATQTNGAGKSRESGPTRKGSTRIMGKGTIQKIKDRLRARSSGLLRRKDQFFEQRYYRKIIGLVPELDHYHTSAIDQLHRIMEKKELKSLREYYKLLKADPEEVTFLKKNLTLMGSHFFRGSDWDVLEEQCLPSFEGRAKVRVWCAGCSSGEEVYSLIMALLEFVPAEAVEVLATDYNPEMLERCKNGKYGPTHYSEVPERYRKHLIPVKTSFTFSDEIKNTVTVKHLNLLLDDYPTGFDIIVCRNVIKFFTPATVKEIQKKLVDSLAQGGFLFVAVNEEGTNKETIEDPASLHVKQYGDSIYQKL